MEIKGNSAAEIFDHVRELVQSGRMVSGYVLPPVRDLAIALDINRNTVAAAYKRLTAAGIAVAQGRLGTTICWQAALGEQEGTSADSPLIDLASGNPNPALLPRAAEVLAQLDHAPRLYGAPTINEQLQQLARGWFDADCPAPYEVELSHGAVDGIERLAAAHLAAGDRIAVEEPCFLGTINALRIAGLQAIGVEIDEQGMLPEALERTLQHGAQALLITPRAHNPTGCSLTASRAAALRRVLKKFPHVLVIVDDHFALLCDSAYHSIIPASTHRWALIRSVSKALGPDLRLAFIASDAMTSQRLRLRLAPGMTWVSHLLQDLVGLCLTTPAVAARIGTAKAAYAARRIELHTALQAQGIAATVAADGFNLWLPLQQDARDVAHKLARRGWLVRTGDSFDVQGRAQALRVTVSTMEDGQATSFAADLRGCLDE